MCHSPVLEIDCAVRGNMGVETVRVVLHIVESVSENFRPATSGFSWADVVSVVSETIPSVLAAIASTVPV